MSWNPKNKEDRPEKVRYTEYVISGRPHLRIFFPNTCNNWIASYIKSLPEYYDLIETRQLMVSYPQGIVLLDGVKDNIKWAWEFWCYQRDIK